MKRKFVPKFGNVSNRLLSLLLALIMVLGMVPGVAFAETNTDTVTVHYLNTNGWSAVNGYVWDSTGSNNSWPGSALAENADHEGWFDLVVIDTDGNFSCIFNSGSNQTSDIAVDHSDGTTEFWYVNGSLLKVAPDSWTSGETVEPTTITVHYKNSSNWSKVNGYVWESTGSNNSWPGSSLSENADNAGWFDLVVIDTDGSFSCIFNSGSSQTSDIKVDHSDGTTEFWYDGSLSKTAPTDWDDGKDDGTVTVHYLNTNGWSAVNGYVWDSTGSNNSWPGSALAENTDHEGWFDLVVIDTDGAFNCIFNDGNGNQTSDIAVDHSDGTTEFWYVNGSLLKVAPDSWTSGETVEPTTITVHYKNSSNWSKVNGYVWESTGSNNSWPGSSLSENADNAGWFDLVVIDTDGSFSCIFNNGSSQTADIKVDHSDGITEFWYDGSLSKTAPADWDDGSVVVPIPVDYYLYGWINGADVTGNDYKFEDGKLTITFTAADNYVFIKNDSGVSYMTDGWLGNGVKSAVLSASYSNGDKLYVPAGEHTFTITENSDGTLTLSYETKVDPEPTPVDYYLYGWINGADVTGNDYKFEDGKLTITFTAADNYVFIKNASGASYMTDGWLGNGVKSAVLSTSYSNGDKLYVPAGDLEFTLTENDDGTLTLSYEAKINAPEIPDGYNTVTIHFLKPSTWGGTINAWVWDSNGALPGYEKYQTAWPGSPIPANADKDGWYDLVIGTAQPQAFNFIFNDGSSQTADLTTGAITGPTELWVVDGTVYTTAPAEWTHYTATLHFQKPANWSNSINTYAWNDNGVMLGGWPGTAASSSPNAGWYTTTVKVEIGEALNFIFNDGSNQTSDLSAGVLTDNIELWILSDESFATNAPDGWIDAARTIHLPGTLGNNNWNAAGNQMEYDAERGLYTITFKDVTPGTYEYKIAVNGAWAENYGANGEKDGSNMSVSVPTKQDVTFWYNDSTHRVVNSVEYDIDATVLLTGFGAVGYELHDDDLDGIYTVTLTLSAGIYDELKITYGESEIPLGAFELTAEKDVSFSFDPSTGMAYHNGSDKKVNTANIYYNSKDLAYKAPFGAVATGESVTFSITTGTDATGVALVLKGLPSVSMTKDGAAANGVQRWTCTTSFDTIGEYDYYFAITNGSDLVVYCDDNWNSYYKTGDYGEGGIGNLSDIFAYDLVVYEAGYQTPDWMKNAVIYQIFPDRFYNADTSNDQAQTWARGEVDYEYVDNWYLLPENPEMSGESNYPTYAYKGDGNWSNEIYGGDLKGITEKIDYLKALGVNVIYLNPVFWSISNHRYDACSYTEIDPILGTLGDFEELVAVAEANDMHIILDGVFNHVSDDSVYFDRYYKFLGQSEKIGAYPYWAYVYDQMNDNGLSQADAEAAAKDFFGKNYGITDYSYTEWFAVQNVKTVNADKIGLRAGKEVYSYEGWWGYDSMPVIYSTNGSEYQTGNWAEEIISGEDSVNAYWISKGMDGWRLDVANEVSDETWQNFRDSVKALDSKAVIIGEIWADSTRYLLGDMYDSVMNYVFRDAVAGFARGYLINRDNKAEMWDSSLTADEATTILEILRERYPEEAFYAMMNLVGSHDTARILSYLDDVEDDRYQKDMKSAFPMYNTTSDRAKQLQYVVAFLQFTYAGAPTIYYGDEIGMTGGDDPDDRRAFEWNVLDENAAEYDESRNELLKWYSILAAIRANYSALRTGAVDAFSTGNDDVMGFIRRDSNDTIVVLANRSDAEQEITLNLTALDITAETLTDLIDSTVSYTIDGTAVVVKVPAYRGSILLVEGEDPAPELPAGPTLYAITKAACEHGKVTAHAIMAAAGASIKVSAVPAEGYRVASLTVIDAAGNEIEVADGKFTMPASRVTVSATFVYDLPFTDVADDAENFAAIAYMYKNGLMIGTSAEEYTFDGDMTMTRSQIAMILYRLAGEPETAYAGTFTDAPEGVWYTEAVEWAASKDIINGVGNDTFAPSREITVVELAVLTYRYAQCQLHGQCEAADWETESAAAMTWCVENGVLTEGTSASAIADRNLAAEMFYAVDTLISK